MNFVRRLTIEVEIELQLHKNSTLPMRLSRRFVRGKAKVNREYSDERKC